MTMYFCLSFPLAFINLYDALSYDNISVFYTLTSITLNSVKIIGQHTVKWNISGHSGLKREENSVPHCFSYSLFF